MRPDLMDEERLTQKKALTQFVALVNEKPSKLIEVSKAFTSFLLEQLERFRKMCGFNLEQGSLSYYSALANERSATPKFTPPEPATPLHSKTRRDVKKRDATRLDAREVRLERERPFFAIHLFTDEVDAADYDSSDKI